MKTFCALLLTGIFTVPVLCQHNSDTLWTPTYVENQSINQQISLIQTSLDNLVTNISNGATIKIDTAKTVTRLDSLSEEDKGAKTIKFRLEVLEESINNLSKGLSNKMLSTADCHREIVGWYSCNCRAPDVSGGTVHCDVCPIYRWVCN